MQIKFDKEFRCPCCGKKLNAGVNRGEAPSPNHKDFAICSGCAAILCIVVDSDGISFREVTDDDMFEIGAQSQLDEEIRTIQRMIRDGNADLLIKTLSKRP